MKSTKTVYSIPSVEVIEMNAEVDIMTGTNENIGGHDLAPVFDDPIIPNLL